VPGAAVPVTSLAGTRFQASRWHFCRCAHQRHVLLLKEAARPGLLRRRLSAGYLYTDDALGAPHYIPLDGNGSRSPTSGLFGCRKHQHAPKSGQRTDRAVCLAVPRGDIRLNCVNAQYGWLPRTAIGTSREGAATAEVAPLLLAAGTPKAPHLRIRAIKHECRRVSSVVPLYVIEAFDLAGPRLDRRAPPQKVLKRAHQKLADAETGCRFGRPPAGRGSDRWGCPVAMVGHPARRPDRPPRVSPGCR
jgi:hypothetical protein